MNFRALFLTLAVVPLAVSAAEEVDQTLEASPDGLVDITNTRGEIEVIGWSKNNVSVEGELDSLAEEFIFETRGDRTIINVKIPDKGVNWGSGSDLVIHVPEKSRVSFDGVSSDGEFKAIGGGLRGRTASGDIDASEIAEQVYIKTVSGDIDVRDSSGQINISSVSGEIILEVESDRVSLDTVSGDVDAHLGRFDRLYVNAVSGDLEIEGALADDGEIEINSVSGDITLALSEPVNARLSISTGPGGDISNGLTDDPVKEQFPAMNSLKGESGDGSGEISIRTISGDINLESDD